MLIVTGILYVFFAKSELQSWNSVSNQNIEMVAAEELKKLREKDDDQNKEQDYKKVPIDDEHDVIMSVAEEKQKI